MPLDRCCLLLQLVREKRRLPALPFEICGREERRGRYGQSEFPEARPG